MRYKCGFDNDVAIVTCQGELNGTWKNASLLEQLEEAGVYRVLMECSQLYYINSAGLRQLLEFHQWLGNHEGGFSLVAVEKPIREVLQVTGVLKLFTLYNTLEEALDAYRGAVGGGRGVVVKPTVLVVDDAEFMRELLREQLEGLQYLVVEAEDAEAAVDLYRRAKPDVVIMDLTMPGRDGMWAIREILSLDASAKIIVCSSESQTPTVRQALRMGVRDYVLKPFDKGRIAAALESVLAPAPVS